MLFSLLSEHNLIRAPSLYEKSVIKIIKSEKSETNTEKGEKNE